MESKTDDALKARFFEVRKEIYNRYSLSRVNMSQSVRHSNEV